MAHSRSTSLAEKYRKHREAFALALELRVGLKEAEAIIAQRAARARWEETNQRLTVRMQNSEIAQFRNLAAEPERPMPYWKQGDLA